MQFGGLLVVVVVSLTLTDAASLGTTNTGPTDLCTSKVYCEGPLLQTVQLAGIFNDSKTFVDLSQLKTPDVTLANFDKLMQDTDGKPTRDQVAAFVEANFIMQDELYNVTLPDWKESPSILKRIRDPNYRVWASSLNIIWKNLARRMTDDVSQNPEKHSLIYVKNTFIIPGGRFREFYYWDSYWIILGLLLCDMNETAKGMIQNFGQMIGTFGFIPNGGRVYYLMRSQPPLFIPMVNLYFEMTQDYEFLRSMVPLMEEEFSYWETKKTVEVTKNGKTYKMVRYFVDSPQPRPESYREDYSMAQNLPKSRRAGFYNNLKAAAESGWDFSNRWCIEETKNSPLSLLNISTSDIIPVDLNAFVEQNARQLSMAHAILHNPAKALNYKKIAAEYRSAIDNVLWNEEEGTWFDYDLKNQKSRKDFYVSNLVPLYTRSYDINKVAKIASRSINYLKKNKIDSFFGGTPTSLSYTGEQWDYPNAWPPLQSLMAIGLERTEIPEAREFAKALCEKWLSANYKGFLEYGKMFEKYNAIVPGEGGGGGEYSVQEGFGWTNGVILQFLNTYPDLKPNIPDMEEYDLPDLEGSTDHYGYARLRRSINENREESTE